MRKSLFFISILLLAILVIIGAGCGKKEGEKGIPAEEEPAAAETEEEAPSLEEITQKAKNLGEYKFDATTTQPTESDIKYTMWVKGNNIRWEGSMEGQNVIYLMNTVDKTAYVHMPAQNMAIKQDFAQTQKTIGESPDQKIKEIEIKNPEVVGVETIDGKRCLLTKVVADTGDVTKTWIWTKYGIPIKIEITPRSGGVITTTFSNIEFGGISDNKFELPSGVQIMDVPSYNF